MNKKHHGGPAPVPQGNRPAAGPPQAEGADVPTAIDENADGSPFQDQDAKRRLGGFEGAGEHAIQQPGRLNDGDRHSQ